MHEHSNKQVLFAIMNIVSLLVAIYLASLRISWESSPASVHCDFYPFRGGCWNSIAYFTASPHLFHGLPSAIVFVFSLSLPVCFSYFEWHVITKLTWIDNKWTNLCIICSNRQLEDPTFVPTEPKCGKSFAPNGVVLIDFQKQMILVTPKWTRVWFNMQKKGYWSTISCNVVEIRSVLTLGNTQEHSRGTYRLNKILGLGNFFKPGLATPLTYHKRLFLRKIYYKKGNILTIF